MLNVCGFGISFLLQIDLDVSLAETDTNSNVNVAQANTVHLKRCAWRKVTSRKFGCHVWYESGSRLTHFFDSFLRMLIQVHLQSLWQDACLSSHCAAWRASCVTHLQNYTHVYIHTHALKRWMGLNCGAAAHGLLTHMKPLVISRCNARNQRNPTQKSALQRRDAGTPLEVGWNVLVHRVR